MPSCVSGGGLTFTKMETRRDLWSLPFDLDRGTSQAQPGAGHTGSSQSHDNPSLARAMDSLIAFSFRSVRTREYLAAGTRDRERVELWPVHRLCSGIL